MEKELTALGLDITHAEAAALARLKTASEFEKALFDGGWTNSRNEAHQILQLLKMRAREVNRIE